MASAALSGLAKIIEANEKGILAEWLDLQKKAGTLQSGRIQEGELGSECREFLHLLQGAAAKGDGDVRTNSALRDFLVGVSRSRALQGFSPTETATFVFSLKEPLFNALNRSTTDAAVLAEGTWTITALLDGLGLQTVEAYQKTREEVILRQQREISELSTPVVSLWDGVLALPIIGTLDSERTQVVMENLLQAIVDASAEIAIIDITGVPTVDTLTAQHLLKTVSAARLMGADCIISGIRPQIAQTIVHLGVQLDVTTKATLADAFAIALRRTGRTVVKTPKTSESAAKPKGQAE